MLTLKRESSTLTRADVFRNGLTDAEGQLSEWIVKSNGYAWGTILWRGDDFVVRYHVNKKDFPLEQRDRIGKGCMVRFSAAPGQQDRQKPLPLASKAELI